MNPTDLSNLILDTLGRVLPRVDPARIDPNVNFRDQLELDSVDYLRFVLALEQALQVQIPQDDYPRLSSLNGCLNYLPARLPEGDA